MQSRGRGPRHLTERRGSSGKGGGGGAVKGVEDGADPARVERIQGTRTKSG
jgi:hypothetical protein